MSAPQWRADYRIKQLPKQQLKYRALSFARRAQMALIVTLVTITALVMLGAMIRRPESD
jgi:hypothetical protein